MDRPNRKRLLQIGAILVIVSVVLFSLSVYLVNANTVTKKGIAIAPGASYHLSKGGVSAGDDMYYGVSPTIITNYSSVTSYLEYGTGATAAYMNASNSATINKVFVSPYSGNVSLVIVNNGANTIYVNANLGIMGYPVLISIVLGIALLPSGAALIIIHFYAKRVEKRKEKIRQVLE